MDDFNNNNGVDNFEPSPKPKLLYKVVGLVIVTVVLAVAVVTLLMSMRSVEPEQNPITQPSSTDKNEPSHEVKEVDSLTDVISEEQAEIIERGVRLDRRVLSMNEDKNKGVYLVDAYNNKTLYSIDSSADCDGSCYDGFYAFMTSGPYLITPGTPNLESLKRLSTVQIREGIYQYTWDGQPLYFYAGDYEVYDTNGDELSGVWSVIKP